MLFISCFEAYYVDNKTAVTTGYLQTERLRDRHAGKLTDGQTGRQTDILTDIQMCIQHTHTHSQTDRQTD